MRNDDYTQMFIDCAPVPGCKNPDSYGMICVRCNLCGRFGDEQPERLRFFPIRKGEHPDDQDERGEEDETDRR